MKHQFPSVTDEGSQHRAEPAQGEVKPRSVTPHWRAEGAGGAGMRLSSHLGAIQSQPFLSHSIPQHAQRGGKPGEMPGFGGGALGKLLLGYSHWIWTNAQGWNTPVLFTAGFNPRQRLTSRDSPSGADPSLIPG